MNKQIIRAALVVLALSTHAPLHAATLDTQTGWAAWINSVKLSEHWGLVSDVQLRSSDDWEDLRTLIVRPGVSYFLDKNNSVTAGYAYIGTYSPTVRNLTEHRSWQQFVAQRKLGDFPLTHRLRLEQRFIERASGGDVYSDRLRYFGRLLVPLKASGGTPFTQGNYLAVQNEVFLNLTGRGDLNRQLLDQNRAYVAFGRRLSAKLDFEVGYLNQFINGRSSDTLNHVIQFALYTRL